MKLVLIKNYLCSVRWNIHFIVLTFNVNAITFFCYTLGGHLMWSSLSIVIPSSWCFKVNKGAILVKLASSPLPLLEFWANGWKWVHLGSQHCLGGVGGWRKEPKADLKIVIRSGVLCNKMNYLEGFFHRVSSSLFLELIDCFLCV